ncbi:homeodomain transcription factor [Lithospermum erythrorhizon]|uniref:Homeodomain transcription factor n=1 Tax=Lithospermum erythrorhizon TaxID=34254 RepID=A0AAV3QWQ6_LITER
MDEYYEGVQDYADKALMSSDDLMTILPTEYSNYHNNLVISSDHQNHHYGVPILYNSQVGGGSEIDIISSIASEKASTTRENEFQMVCTRENNEVLDALDDEGYTLIKDKIVSHPSYPKLLNAYIDCQKVGAPPELASLLDEIRLGNNRNNVPTSYGVDPELDEFMENYCEMLMKYKSDLSRPFGEAATFINNMKIQLGNLCKENAIA